MRKNLIYLLDEPLTELNFQKLGIKKMIKNKWNIEIFEITPFFKPLLYNEFIKRNIKIISFDKHYKIYNKKDLLRVLFSFLFKSNLPTKKYFVDLCDSSIIPLLFRLIFSLKGIKRIVLKTGFMPVIKINKHKSLKKYFNFTYWFKKKFSFYKNDLPKYVLYKLHLFFKISHLVISGNEVLNIFNTKKVNEVIYAHSWDYEIYRSFINNKSKNIELPIKQKYAVFIDQTMHNHPDYIARGEKKGLVSKESYYKSINKALSDFSSSCELKISIFLHPSSDELESRKLYSKEFFIETKGLVEAIAKCDVVLGHYSTALQFAILFNKPILFLTTNDIEKTSRGLLIKSIANELNKNSLNIDSKDFIKNYQLAFNVDRSKYTSYIDKYIKSNSSSNLSLWDIISNRLV